MTQKTPISHENDPVGINSGKSITKQDYSGHTNDNLLSSQKSQKSRIGILRRPDNIESPYNVPLQLTTNATNLTSLGQAEIIHHLPERNGLDVIKTPVPIEPHIPSASKSSEHEMALKVPDSMSLISSVIQRNKLISAEAHAADKKSSVTAYWLRPTPVQPYPYNFIMAVRKKLESITNPVLSSNLAKNSQGGEKMNSDNHAFDTPFGRPTRGYASRLRINLDQPINDTQPPSVQPAIDSSPEKHYVSDDISAYSKSVNQATHSEYSKKQTSLSEDYSTNFSSITLKTSESNEISHLHSGTINKSQLENESRQLHEFLSSTKISHDEHEKSSKGNKNHLHDSQDTLSISSGILSQSSPEKQRRTAKTLGSDRPRQISPLSTDHVDGLHIVSRRIHEKSNSGNPSNEQQEVHATSYINFGRGNNVFENGDQEQFDVHKMLLDFNKSLSQVIKVNEKLHSVLTNPPSSRAAPVNESKHTSEGISTEYSDDFENDSHSKNGLPTRLKSLQADAVSYSAAHKNSLNNKNATPSVQHNVEADQNVTDSRSTQTTYRSKNDKENETQNTNEDEVINSSNNTKSTSTIQTVENYSVVESQSEIKSATSINTVSDAAKSSSTIKEDFTASRTDSQITSATTETKGIELRLSQKQSISDEGPASSSTMKKSLNRAASEKSSQSVKSLQKCITSEREVMNSSIGSDIFAVFNQTAMEFSNDINNSTTWSEGNISYSSLGMVKLLDIFIIKSLQS